MLASTLGALARTMAFVGSPEHGVEWEHNIRLGNLCSE